jgi:hypothetical protein
MGYFSTKQWVPVELPKVFAFFSDPNNLPPPDASRTSGQSPLRRFG